MPCNEWNDQWIAKLWDELDPAEAETLERHLEGCADCRTTLAELDESRSLVRAASPAVPSGPRVILLETRPRRRPVWTYVSGVAAAVLLFVLGAWVGVQQLAPRGVDREQLRSLVAAELAADAAERQALEGRVGELEAALRDADESRDHSVPQVAAVSREEYETGLRDLEQQMRVERMRDMEFMLGEMNAVELRAARWVDETREGLQMVAMQSNLSQR
jgi:anti-sigma factor RsiW